MPAPPLSACFSLVLYLFFPTCYFTVSLLFFSEPTSLHNPPFLLPLFLGSVLVFVDRGLVFFSRKKKFHEGNSQKQKRKRCAQKTRAKEKKNFCKNKKIAEKNICRKNHLPRGQEKIRKKTKKKISKKKPNLRVPWIFTVSQIGDREVNLRVVNQLYKCANVLDRDVGISDT